MKSQTFCNGGPCHGGSRVCSTPDACRREAEDAGERFGAMTGLVRGFPYVIGAWVFIAMVGVAAWWLA